MKREILIYPNPILKEPAKKIKKINKNIKKIIQDMIETVEYNGGVGLAAIQIGELVDLFIMLDTSTEEKEKKRYIPVMNLEFLEKSEELESDEEGCLSVPGITANVNRHKEIKVKYLNIEGKTVIRKFKDFQARILQHEKDHLIGKLFIDRLDLLEMNKVHEKIEELKNGKIKL